MRVDVSKIDGDVIRKLADFEAAAAVETRSKLIDEHNSAFRWMIASLFALNGGAILSLFGREGVGVQPAYLAFWVFLAGIVSTFLAVVFSQASDRAMIARMHSWGLYWVTVGVTADRDEAQEISIKGDLARAERVGRLGRFHAIFAMLFFVLGILTTVVLEQEEAVTKLETRIERLQNDLVQGSSDQ